VDSTTNKAHPHAAGARHQAARAQKRGSRSIRLGLRRANMENVLGAAAAD
jgi:hypothetical protein